MPNFKENPNQLFYNMFKLILVLCFLLNVVPSISLAQTPKQGFTQKDLALAKKNYIIKSRSRVYRNLDINAYEYGLTSAAAYFFRIFNLYTPSSLIEKELMMRIAVHSSMFLAQFYTPYNKLLVNRDFDTNEELFKEALFDFAVEPMYLNPRWMQKSDRALALMILRADFALKNKMNNENININLKKESYKSFIESFQAMLNGLAFVNFKPANIHEQIALFELREKMKFLLIHKIRSVNFTELPIQDELNNILSRLEKNSHNGYTTKQMWDYNLYQQTQQIMESQQDFQNLIDWIYLLSEFGESTDNLEYSKLRCRSLLM